MSTARHSQKSEPCPTRLRDTTTTTTFRTNPSVPTPPPSPSVPLITHRRSLLRDSVAGRPVAKDQAAGSGGGRPRALSTAARDDQAHSAGAACTSSNRRTHTQPPDRQLPQPPPRPLPPPLTSSNQHRRSTSSRGNSLVQSHFGVCKCQTHARTTNQHHNTTTQTTTQPPRNRHNITVQRSYIDPMDGPRYPHVHATASTRKHFHMTRNRSVNHARRGVLHVARACECGSESTDL